MTKSRIFCCLCLAWLGGIGVAGWLDDDRRIIGLAIFMLLALLAVRRNELIWLAGGAAIFFYLGIIYAHWLGQNVLIPTGWLVPVNQFLTGIKNQLTDTNGRILAEPMASLLNGIILGARQTLSPDLKSALNATGLTHLVAVSGYNLTIVAMVLAAGTRPLPYRVGFGVSLAAIVGFVLLTGAPASVVRAGIMGSLAIIARYGGRRRAELIALVVTATVMVAMRPAILTTDIGFQLSAAATLGLLTVSPVLDSLVETITWRRYVPAMIREALVATLAAQVMTAPLILYYFGRLSLIAPLANALAVPLVPSAMGLGGVAVVIGWLSYPLGQIAAWPAWLILKLIIEIAEKLAKLPYASLNMPNWTVWLIIPYLALVYVWIRRANRPKWESKQYGQAAGN